MFGFSAMSLNDTTGSVTKEEPEDGPLESKGRRESQMKKMKRKKNKLLG
jgi:hypothetical protein